MTTEERIARLEGELIAEKGRNRWMLCVGALAILGLILACTLTKAATPGDKQTIRAEAFIVVNSQGRECAKVQADKDGGLSLYDANGKRRLLFFITKDGTLLSLLDESGKLRIALAAMKDKLTELTGLTLTDADGKSRAGLTVIEGRGTGLTLSDENGKPRAGLTVNKDGSGLNLSDENSKPRAGLTVDKDGSGLQMRDENGQPRAAVLLDNKVGPEMNLFDANGEMMWHAP